MKKCKTAELAYVVLGGITLLAILLGVLVFDSNPHLRAGQALQEQNKTAISNDQFWQTLPG